MKINIGFAALGFQGYSTNHANIIINALKDQPQPTLAFLYNSFGTSYSNLKKWYKVCGNSAITIAYLSNEVDRRKSRIDKNSLLYTYDVDTFNKKLENGDETVKNEIQRRTNRIYKFHKNRGAGELRIVCGLEHQLTQKAARVYVNYVKEVVDSSVKVGLNPVIMAPYRDIANADFLEIHELTQKGAPKGMNFVASTDGYDILPEIMTPRISPAMSETQLHTIIKKWAGAEYFLIWHSSFNSLSGASEKNPPPAERKSEINQNFIKYIEKNIINRYKPTAVKVDSYPVVRGYKKALDPKSRSERGFVWKETDVEDHRKHTLVCLFAPKYNERFIKLELFYGDKVDELYFGGFTNALDNVERQTWRSTKQFGTFGKNCILRAKVKKSWWSFWRKNYVCWKIQNSTEIIRNY